MDDGVENENQGKQVAAITVGSVTIPIFHSPNHVKVLKPCVASGNNTAPEFENKTYDSYIIPYYEGRIRKTPRRSTLDKAKEFARETATRLNKDGAQAEFLSERDRRIYVLAKRSVAKTGMDVDEVCRKYVELTQRLKTGTLEEAVDFRNDHGLRVRLGMTTLQIYDEYLKHLEARGVGKYHMRDTKRYLGLFIKRCPGIISPIATPEIDGYLACLGGSARNKNNHRDAIIAFFNFAQFKGYLPQGIQHAASQTTEYRDARQEITSEAQAVALLQPNDIYTPDEARKLLAVADESRVMPTLEIKMLSGVRTEEIIRLWWVMVAEQEGLIRIPDAVGKIDARRVPILPALALRLEKIPENVKQGRVAADWTLANSLYHCWQKVCAKAGVAYKRNAFRNSYFTYRLAILDDINKVAEEGGTSPEMLKKNYLSRAPVSRAMADEWFSL